MSFKSLICDNLCKCSSVMWGGEGEMQRAVYVFRFWSSPSLINFTLSLFNFYIFTVLAFNLKTWARNSYFETIDKSLTLTISLLLLTRLSISVSSSLLKDVFLGLVISNMNGRPFPSIRTSTSSRPEEQNFATEKKWIKNSQMKTEFI